MQKISGDGLVFLEIDGHCKEYDLAAGETLVVDTGYLAAMTESCSVDIEMIRGAKNVFLGGEGLFHTRISGPGKVYIQSMPVSHMAEKLAPYIEIHTSSSSSSGTSFSFGDE
jgi:uncharacterized protein (AIM24 family)